MTKEQRNTILQSIKDLNEIRISIDNMSGEELRKCYNTHNMAFQENADLMMDAVGYIDSAVEHLEELLAEED